MKNLKEFSKEYFAKKKEYEKREEILQNRFEKVKLDLIKLKKPMPKDVIKPLALAIQKELKAKAYYVIDIDSFWSTITIQWVTEPDMKKCRNEHHIAKLEIDRSDEQFIIVERDGDAHMKQYIRTYGNKGIKWLAKYARQKFLNEGVYGN